MKSKIFALIVALLPLQAVAQQAEVPLAVRNAGAQSCDDLRKVYTQQGFVNEKTAFLQWMAGYVTAVARLNSVIDVFPIKDSTQMVQMVILVCGERPQLTVESAVLETAARLRPYWVKGSANVLTLSSNETKVGYYEASVKPLQQALKDAGAPVVVDGAYGNQTGNALSRLSVGAGLPPTLVPNGTLLYLLTRPQQKPKQ
ncbi:hypothetical protein [Actibacterium sp.]|uniref:hypothetical protein n=1 Tax=Actibacterium sp. TaxID=1872125 RepID=UPI0035627EA9